jgi:hypothetical protein
MQNITTICTVFEGHYHKGVAALVNSLHRQGYEGIIWIGYKGALPPWAVIESKNDLAEVMMVCDNLKINFIKFPKEAFLPYCKPDFMHDILEKYQPEAEKIFYIDCDIIIKCPISYFEEWTDYGVALCEDVNSPLPTSHPLRHQWVQYFKKYGITVRRDNAQYVNGGFLGLNRAAKSFLVTWREVQNLVLEDMERIKADLHNSHKGDVASGLQGRNYMFNRTDQDALNVAKDVTTETLSIVDNSGMDFQGVGFIMSHAASKTKPWEKNWLEYVVKKGQRPSPTDRIFLDYVTSPINIYSNNELKFKKVHLKIASALARFMT